VEDRLNSLPKENLIIVHGAAAGVDSIAKTWAMENDIKDLPYPAEWGKYGKSAGPIRNRQMLKDNPDIELVLAFPSPESRGTRDMINAAKEAGFMVEVIELGE